MQKLAITHGQPFLEESDIFNTPTKYLQYAIEHLPDGELISLQLDNIPLVQTYAQLWNRSKYILGGLRLKGLHPGTKVVVLLEQCHNFVAVLWSCFMGGLIPVPIRFSLNHSQPHQLRLKLNTVLELLDQPIILTTEAISSSLQRDQLLENNPSLIYLEEIEASLEVDEEFYPSNPDDLGALFLSSGTTGKPKLVSLSCQAIVNRLLFNQSKNPQDIRSLYWLPLDHASACLRIANPIAQQQFFLPTEVFLINPLRWLDAIDQYGITRTSITNFGMALINQFIESSSDRIWDLTSIKNLGIGAEAIIPKTYDSFLKSLMPFGLRADAVFTGYGLTECGTVVGGKPFLLNDLNADNQFMTLGSPCQGYSIRIIDEQGSLLNEGEVGEVQVKGPSMTRGYYQNVEETQSLFTDDGWMNTGDLGFIQAGNLTITGRFKDIIIINAKNYSCQIIEQVVESIENVTQTSAVACAIRQPDSTTDELAIFFNTSVLEDQQLIKVINQIRLSLATQLDITPTYLVPIAQDDIPRTSFGKIQRQKLAQRLQLDEFTDILKSLDQLTKTKFHANFVAPKTETEKAIAKIWSDVFQFDPIGIYDNFFELGGGSLLATKIIYCISKDLDYDIPLHCLFENPTIAELAHYIDNQNCTQPISYTSLVSLKTNGSKTPLYFINSTREAQALIPLMDAEQPIYSLNIFGLTPLLEKKLNQLQIRDIAQYFIKDLKTVQPYGPYQLIGYCQDGALTLETAQLLRSQGEKVELVCLIDVIFQMKKLSWLNRLEVLQEFGLYYLISRIRLAKKKKKIEPNVQKDNQAKTLNKTERDQLLYAAYLRAIVQYIPLPYQGPIISLQSSEWSYKDQSALKAIAIEGLESYLVKGLHSHLFEDPFVQDLAEKLRLSLSKNLTR